MLISAKEYYFEVEEDLLDEGYDFCTCWVYFETEEDTEEAIEYFEAEFEVEPHFDQGLDPCIEIYLGNVKRHDEEAKRQYEEKRDLCEEYLRALL